MNSSTAATAASTSAPADETLLQRAEDEVKVVEQDVGAELEKVAALFSADVWPCVKAGFMMLLSVAGKAAMQAEMAAIPAELSGNEAIAAAAVGAAITGAVAANADAVLKTEGAQAIKNIDADPNATAGEKALAAEGGTLIPAQPANTGGSN